jgi:hypothetical protein
MNLGVQSRMFEATVLPIVLLSPFACLMEARPMVGVVVKSTPVIDLCSSEDTEVACLQISVPQYKILPLTHDIGMRSCDATASIYRINH